MRQGDILQFSSKAQTGRAVLYSAYNDITIFVEDTSLEHFYEDLFNRLLGEFFEIRKVFALGGKKRVIEEYQKFKNGNTIKNPFFILDRDLDPFLGIEEISDEALIYLKKYCIENYLISSDTFFHAAKWKYKENHKEILDYNFYEKWHQEIIDDFFELFIAFTFCRKHNLGVSADISPYKYIDNHGYHVDKEAVKDYIENLKTNYLKLYPHKDFVVEFESIKNKVLEYVENDKTSVISGKFLFCSLKRYTQFICNSKNIDEDIYLGLLSHHINLNELEFIKKKILKEAN